MFTPSKQGFSICSCSALKSTWVPAGIPPNIVRRACHDIFGVLCTVYSLLPHCFIWTFLTRIALNYARWGAVWQPLKMKYLLVFSQARDQRGRRFTWSGVAAPNLLALYSQNQEVFKVKRQIFIEIYHRLVFFFFFYASCVCYRCSGLHVFTRQPPV